MYVILIAKINGNYDQNRTYITTAIKDIFQLFEPERTYVHRQGKVTKTQSTLSVQQIALHKPYDALLRKTGDDGEAAVVVRQRLAFTEK
jgi:hypothetical protein